MIVVSMNLYLVLYILNIQYRIPISGYIKRYLHSIRHSTKLKNDFFLEFLEFSEFGAKSRGSVLPETANERI